MEFRRVLFRSAGRHRETGPPLRQDGLTTKSPGRTGAFLVDQFKPGIGPPAAYYSLVPLLSGPVSNHSIKHGFDSGKTIDLELRPDKNLIMSCHIKLEIGRRPGRERVWNY